MSSKVVALAVCLLSYITNGQFRLPNTILPTNYDLTLYPNIDANTFDGIVLINIDITNAYFNDSDTGNFSASFNTYPGLMNIDPDAATFHVNVATDNDIYPLISFEEDSTTQIATATFNIDKSVVEGLVNEGTNTFTLRMEYVSTIRGGTDLAGLYRSDYEDDNGNLVRNLITQFQATDARSVFPCFDEPAFKATFDITYIAPTDSVTLSNTEIMTELYV